MRRFQLFPVLILVSLTLSLVGIAAPTTYAKPLTTNCTGGCYAWFAWNGTTYGGAGTFEVAGAITFHTSKATFQRWAGFWGVIQGTDGHGAIHVGEEVDAPYSGPCGGLYTVETEWWLVQAWDANNNVIASVCQPINSGNFNTGAVVRVHPYVSNGGGMLVNIYPYCCQTVAPVYIPYSSGALHSFASMGYQEQIFDNVEGHEVWGAYNDNWEWYSGGKYNLQTRYQDILSAENPPQMYWLSGYGPPQFPGGWGISCDYDGGPQSCTHVG